MHLSCPPGPGRGGGGGGSMQSPGPRPRGQEWLRQGRGGEGVQHPRPCGGAGARRLDPTGAEGGGGSVIAPRPSPRAGGTGRTGQQKARGHRGWGGGWRGRGPLEARGGRPGTPGPPGAAFISFFFFFPIFFSFSFLENAGGKKPSEGGGGGGVGRDSCPSEGAARHCGSSGTPGTGTPLGSGTPGRGTAPSRGGGSGDGGGGQRRAEVPAQPLPAAGRCQVPRAGPPRRYLG